MKPTAEDEDNEPSFDELGLPIDLVRTVLGGVLKAGVASGELSFAHLNETERLNTIRTFLEGIVNSGRNLQLTIDHRDDVLRHARLFKRRSDWNMSILCYATYFEHTINAFLVVALRTYDLDEKMIARVIRDVNFPGKISWLIPIIYAEKFNPVHASKMLTIMNLRNSFVHYKFAAAEKTDQITSDGIANIQKTIEYLKRYEDRNVLRGHKVLIDKIGRRRLNT